MIHPATLLKQLGGHPRSRFGQNFLASEKALRCIVQAADLGPDDRVLEIGPGLGVLTEALLTTEAELVAVEIDRDLHAFLARRFADASRLRLIQADAMDITDWSSILSGAGWRCIANLPYNVGTRLVTTMLRQPATFDRLVVMLQAEVAQRLLAPPGDRRRGSLSVFAQSRASIRRCCRVPPGAFHPPPKVSSTVVELRLFAQPQTGGVAPDRFEALTRQLHASPRKSIRNNLSRCYPRPRVDAALEAAGLEARLRPSDLSGAAIASLSHILDPSPPGG